MPTSCTVCGKVAVARDLCRAHYNAARERGEFTPDPELGRPRSDATPPPEPDAYTPSHEELVTRAKQVAWEILNSERASQAERNNVLKLFLSGKNGTGLSPDEREEMKNLFGAARGE